MTTVGKPNSTHRPWMVPWGPKNQPARTAQRNWSSGRHFVRRHVLDLGTYPDQSVGTTLAPARPGGSSLMRGSNDEDEPSGVVMVGWALFLSVVVVAMALIVSASIETALAPPMSPSAPGEGQLTAFETWIVVAILLAIEGF